MSSRSPDAVQASLVREALFRYQVVSKVLARETTGEGRAKAIAKVAGELHYDFGGVARRVSLRSIYRWTARFVAGEDVRALEPASRQSTVGSKVLASKLIAFFAQQKKDDPRASIPELIERAKELGLVDPESSICRSTVYRTLKRSGVCVKRRKNVQERDSRRFAYAHRLQMVLCDGKHFRAGVTRARRVALFFLDDSTRYCLHEVVGTSESTVLFLRGLYEVIRKYGFMIVIYLDHGPGFFSDDAKAVMKRLGICFLYGETAYPPGHGKIEAFNKTGKAALLRGFDRRPDVNPDCSALALRIGHWAHERYNRRPHESLDGDTPFKRFHGDETSLRFPESDEYLRSLFVLHVARRVSGDHVIPIDSTFYEMPRGYAGAKVTIQRRFLDGTVHFLHLGRYIELHPVDLVANAHTRRAPHQVQEEEEIHPSPKSAADLAFDKAFGPVVGPDGGFPKTQKEDDER